MPATAAVVRRPHPLPSSVTTLPLSGSRRARPRQVGTAWPRQVGTHTPQAANATGMDTVGPLPFELARRPVRQLSNTVVLIVSLRRFWGAFRRDWELR